MAQFSDTTNQSGLIQRYERWTRRPYGTLTGDTLKEATNDLNASFEDLMPMLLEFNDQLRWDDLNHTDAPIGRLNLVSGQNDYKITVDDNSLDILNIVKVRIFPSSTSTVYTELERITPDDHYFAEIMSPSTGATGVPSGYVELGNVIYLDLPPSYSATNGIEIFFQREQSYFTSSDTTKEPGIPKPFHELLAMKAAMKWNMVNRADDSNLLGLLQKEIDKKEKELRTFINLRHPSRSKITMKKTNFI